MKPLDVAPYERIVAVVKREGRVTHDELLRVLRVTPGLFLKLNTTWEKVIRTMVNGGWLQKDGDRYFVGA